MNGSLRFVSLKMVVLGLSLSALSTAGVVVMAQQRPNPALRGGDGYGNAAVSVRVDAPEPLPQRRMTRGSLDRAK